MSMFTMNLSTSDRVITNKRDIVVMSMHTSTDVRVPQLGSVLSHDLREIDHLYIQ